ncbi:hypothetical protein [Halobaculum magnesiiphilum]|uniref:Uncharacterized protein n=1 Tax=Halobaculum magnesiiphilum TaxID=1017351 RepID=A0A8T8W9T8_9EURY|nr:hypothetical protein [Halobaculum magnesiiphilum]QZP36586.1 hypothetical protein K6T50_09690 [Halobaculum magnesiiphilum]
MSGTDSEFEIDGTTAELLQKKGTIEILVRIGERRTQRHTDLRKELLLSSSTVQERLKAGKQQGLWVQELEDRKGVSAKVYRLTELGQWIYDHAVDEELNALYQTRREVIREIQDRERRLILKASPSGAEWVSDIQMEEHSPHDFQKFLQQFIE